VVLSPATRIGASLVALLVSSAGVAQEMEPRAYSPSPVGLNFLAVTAGRSEGDVLVDPTIPLTDVSATLDHIGVGYGRTFALFGRQALVIAGIPFVNGTVEGQIGETSRRADREGFADLRVKASINLIGPGPLSAKEFAQAPRQTVVGVSLAALAPIGEYQEGKLVNLSTNRWAFKPEAGVSVPVGQRWYLDGYAGVTFFTDNDEYFPGSAVREQDPLVSLQAHASYSFPSRAWLALDATWYGGGQATVDGGSPTAHQSNTRFGATGSLPVAKHQSVKLAVSRGLSTRTGSDFDTYVFGWQIAWLTSP
jgi:hypothetical protein